MSQLESRLRDKTAVIGVVGLGYVGLPLAVAFAQTGLKVIAFDIQAEKVEAVNQGKSYITGTSSKTLSALVASNRLQAATDQSHLTGVDAICVCVPTPLNKAREPDLSYVVHESEKISEYLKPGQLVVL